MIRKLTPHTIHVDKLCDIAKGPALPNPKATNLLNFMLMARVVFDKARFVRTSPTVSLNFCTVWIINSGIYILPIYFFK